jgi:hypothetical protein
MIESDFLIFTVKLIIESHNLIYSIKKSVYSSIPKIFKNIFLSLTNEQNHNRKISIS